MLIWFFLIWFDVNWYHSIQFDRWLRLCIRAEFEEMYPLAVKFVTQQGRMKYIRPLYRLVSYLWSIYYLSIKYCLWFVNPSLCPIFHFQRESLCQVGIMIVCSSQISASNKPMSLQGQLGNSALIRANAFIVINNKIFVSFWNQCFGIPVSFHTEWNIGYVSCLWLSKQRCIFPYVLL